MARTELASSNLVFNGAVAQPAGVAGTTDGHFVDDAVPEQSVLRVVIATATSTVTIKAGSYPPALAAGQGDVANSLAVGTHLLGPFESGRFQRADGTWWVDYGTPANTTITLLKVPRS